MKAHYNYSGDIQSDLDMLDKKASESDAPASSNSPSDQEMLDAMAQGKNIAPQPAPSSSSSLMNDDIGGKLKSGTATSIKEPTLTDKALHLASIYGKAAVTGPIQVPALAADIIPALLNAGRGAYHDLTAPDGREVFDPSTAPDMVMPSTALNNMLTNKQNNPLAFDKPQGKWEEGGTDLVNALTSTQAGINMAKKSGPLINRLLTAAPKTQLASAVTSTAAGDIAKDQGYGVGGQIGASILAGGITSIPGLLPSTPEQIAASALRYASPVEQKTAQELMDHSYAIGTPITASEALAQVKGNSTLQPVQRVIEQSAAGGPDMEKFMQGRVSGNEKALGSSLNNIADNKLMAQLPDVSDIPIRASQAAENAIKDVKAQRTAATSPSYTAAGPQFLKQEQVQPIIENLDKEIALAGGKSDTGKALQQYKEKLMTMVSNPVTKDVESTVLDQYGKPIVTQQTSAQKAPGIQTQIGPLDTAYKETKADLKLPVVSPKAIPYEIAGKLGPINSQLGQALATNSDIAQGRAIHAGLSDSIVNPLEQGVIGQIAGDNTMRGQGNKLLPANPSAYDEKSVANTINTLKGQDSDIGKLWTRQFLQDNFNESAQKLQSGNNQFGGAKFTSNITGNNQQAKNLRAAIISSADTAEEGQNTYDGFKKMLNVFEAQGKRLPVGSPTTNNAEIIGQLKGSGSDNVLPVLTGAGATAAYGGLNGLTAGASVKVINNLLSKYQNWKYGQNAGDMAKILTDPQGIKELQRLAKMKTSSPEAAILVRSLINPLQQAQ